jgi:hypothetical protein
VTNQQTNHLDLVTCSAASFKTCAVGDGEARGAPPGPRFPKWRVPTIQHLNQVGLLLGDLLGRGPTWSLTRIPGLGKRRNQLTASCGFDLDEGAPAVAFVGMTTVWIAV